MRNEDEQSRKAEEMEKQRLRELELMLEEENLSILRELLEVERNLMITEDERSRKLRIQEWAAFSATIFIENKIRSLKERLGLDKEDRQSKERELDEKNKLRYRLKLKLADRLGMFAADLESRQFEEFIAEEVAKQQLHELQMFERASSKIQNEILEAFILQNSQEVALDSLKTYKEHEDLASAINN